MKLLQAAGRWKDALRVAAKHDRIHLRTTHYLYAQYLESLGEHAEALKQYEKALTHRQDVPRMLMQQAQMDSLEAYIRSSQDKQLYAWWAQYCESNGQYEESLKYYEMANDTLALVRVHCYRGDFEKAAEICNTTQDKAACFHLARQYEAQDMGRQAIQFYTRAKRFNHGIRLAKEQDLDTELMQLALESQNKELQYDVARHFEAKGLLDQAVVLLQKAGRLTRALELCFNGRLFEALRSIVDNLGPDTDPSLLSRAASFVLENGQFDKAVHLLVAAKRFAQALDLCVQHRITINEVLAEKLTPPRAEGEPEETSGERVELLKKLAHVLKDQGSYHLACKKYTQAGDKIRAMKCLLKSNDTEKIIFYASVTKRKEIYILAANYLQNLDWHNDPEISKTIIGFYVKAKAYQQLAVFYDACAQVEIDEYRDYDKAVRALQESLRALVKAKPGGETGGSAAPAQLQQHAQQQAQIESRIRLVERFVAARAAVRDQPQEMIKICNQLLQQPDVESAIRIGDVYALLIEYYYSKSQHAQAYQLIQQMRASNIILNPYLDSQMVQTIHRAVGAQYDDAQEGGDEIGEVPS